MSEAEKEEVLDAAGTIGRFLFRSIASWLLSWVPNWAGSKKKDPNPSPKSETNPKPSEAKRYCDGARPTPAPHIPETSGARPAKSETRRASPTGNETDGARPAPHESHQWMTVLEIVACYDISRSTFYRHLGKDFDKGLQREVDGQKCWPREYVESHRLSQRNVVSEALSKNPMTEGEFSDHMENSDLELDPGAQERLKEIRMGKVS